MSDPLTKAVVVGLLTLAIAALMAALLLAVQTDESIPVLLRPSWLRATLLLLLGGAVFLLWVLTALEPPIPSGGCCGY